MCMSSPHKSECEQKNRTTLGRQMQIEDVLHFSKGIGTIFCKGILRLSTIIIKKFIEQKDEGYRQYESLE